MERWRSFFGNSGEDLWTVIDRAITIAAVDYPQELRVRRDAFAEKLYTPATLSSTSNITEGPRLDERVDNLFASNLCPLTSSIGERPALTRSDGGTGTSPESETRDVLEGQQKVPKVVFHDSNLVVDCKSLKKEALTEESEQSLQIREILVLKEQIMDLNQTEEACLLVLSKLENMNIYVPALKVTGIGKPVNGLRKHASRRVRSVVRRLVSSWKDVVDEWVKKEGDDFAAAFVDSGNSDMNGGDMEMSSPFQINNALSAMGKGSPQMLDIRDDDFSAGSGQMNSNDHERIGAAEPGATSLAEERHPRSNFQMRNPRYENVFISSEEKFERVGGGSKPPLDCIGNSCNKLDTVHRSSNMALKPPDPTEVIPKQNQFSSKVEADMKPKCTEGPYELHRLEAVKQRLYQNNQQAENAKKQRTVQVMDRENLPNGVPTQPKSNWTGYAKPMMYAKRACPINIRG
ncbi:hypothetical protein O6H91_05G038400 [Diphasiastrum complanatum]|uniref:Uncharacterized protein n=1 Tax=Diphasiastrum complanatum TaxID=34168 RepID=A0ACC2DMC1_DIPCM|nr:hypothetical protein O6H91_05G038400 [Diphasiastrum complanatum]